MMQHRGSVSVDDEPARISLRHKQGWNVVQSPVGLVLMTNGARARRAAKAAAARPNSGAS
jgi:hypothetical protein